MPEPSSLSNLLKIEDLRVQFQTPMGTVKAVDGISYTVAAGETVAIVGESGCGKSMSALSVLRLIPSPPGRIAAALGPVIRSPRQSGVCDIVDVAIRRCQRWLTGPRGLN